MATTPGIGWPYRSALQWPPTLGALPGVERRRHDSTNNGTDDVAISGSTGLERFGLKRPHAHRVLAHPGQTSQTDRRSVAMKLNGQRRWAAAGVVVATAVATFGVALSAPPAGAAPGCRV